MVNDDVIATSGLCLHLDATDASSEYGHIYVTDIANTLKYFNSYQPGASSNSIKSMGTDSRVATLFKTSPEVNTWYYWNGSQYEKCEEQSNDAHPIKNPE